MDKVRDFMRKVIKNERGKERVEKDETYPGRNTVLCILNPIPRRQSR